MATIRVDSSSCLTWGHSRVRCALGRTGIVANKQEGDGGTPAGRHPLRVVYFRDDRVAAPVTRLPVVALSGEDGWCDDPKDRAYNQPVKLPYRARCERLWRDDHLYDVVVVLGYNDDPIVAGRGSAIFLHVAREAYAPTEGCIALALNDLLNLLGSAEVGAVVEVEPI